MDTVTETKDALIDRKGQRLIIFVILIYFFNEVVFSPIIGQFNIVRILLTIGLIYFLYEGHSWARILTGLLSGLAMGTGITIAVVYGDKLPGLLLGFLWVMNILHFVAALILLFSQNAITFLKMRRARPKL